MKIVLRNPCKKCIVRATCREKCEKIESYHSIFTCSLIAVTSVTLFILVVCIAFILYKSQAPRLGLGILSGLIVFGYTCSIAFLNDECLDENDKWYKKAAAYIFGTWLILPVYIYGRYEEEIELFIFRFNYKIHSYIYNLAKKKGKIC